ATGAAWLRVGVVDRGTKVSPAYSLAVSRRGQRSYSISPSIGDGTLWSQPLRPDVRIEDNQPTRWNLIVGEGYPMDRISPVWEDDFRRSVENDMLSLPEERTHWRRLRIEVRDERVRMYHDGVLVFDEAHGAMADGAVALELMGPARLADLNAE